MHLLFLFTFPGYFAYHYLVSMVGMPPVLAGYSTPLCLVSLPILLTVHLRWRMRVATAPQPLEQLLWVFLLYYAAVTLWNWSTRNLLNSAEAHPTVIAQFVALYLLGHHTPSERRHLPLLLTALVLMTAAVVHNSLAGGLIAAALEDAGVGIGLTNYQGYAFAYLVTLVWTVTLLRGRAGRRLTVYAIAGAALFLNGARSEFATALVSTLSLEVLVARSKGTTVIGILVASLALLAAYFVFEEDLRDYRVIALLTDYSEDLSVLDRRKMYSDGVATILAHPIMGRMGTYQGGEYIHNYLSAWVDLGAPGFALFVALSVMPAVYLWVHRRRFAADAELHLLFMLTASTLLSSLAAKPFTQYLLPLTLGVCVGHARRYDSVTPSKSAPASANAGTGTQP
jgi:hypothetical protein